MRQPAGTDLVYQTEVSMPKPAQQITTGGILRAMLAEAVFLTALPKEHEPACPAMLQHVRFVCAFAIEGDQRAIVIK